MPVPSSGSFSRAARYLAGGVDSPVRAGAPMGGPGPILRAARGSRVFDIDGREYIDYLCAYGPVILGHSHPAISAAVAAASQAGTVFGTTHDEEIRLAERLTTHLPSLERLRFVNTGTEACMSAVRLARAHTGRSKLVRFVGNYHGHSDGMIFSAGASANTARNGRSGVTRGVARDVIVLPYDDVAALRECFGRHRADIAAVIVEPVAANMGLVLPDARFLSELCALCRESKALSIFDEVITGFRLGLGGAQGRLGILPDLTCLGKALGGGLPIAAFGGRQAIMDGLAPVGAVFAGGTFSGNPLCVAAARACLDVIEGDVGFYPRLESLGRRLASGAQAALVKAGLPYPVVSIASMVDFMFRTGPPHRDAAQAAQADSGAYARFYWAMLDEGIMLAPSQNEVMFLTAAHTEKDVDATIGAIERALLRSR
ncbi:MAG: glutamate-1-semialdehyde 2,1-aminomutase [Candidatus Eremiobacteraeota bacterium]|nr:glutamate-1-semialdehyde 2,1-aminomutase [Candidatus Eremiobacteraeota bacterium]MBC5828139.1 glutamate-1-semialdehyde 2,1-aminomutase [Candidatus Eremiobacteraeota bacterium]